MTSPNGHGIAVWVLGIVFAWSGIAKLRSPTLAAMAIVDFGVSLRVIPRLGSALGVAELSLALLLATGMLPRIFLTVTAGLLWLFVLLIVRSRWAGERFACFCFGDVDSELSHPTLVRTATLALLASVAAVVPPPVVAYPGFTVTDALQAASAMSIVGTIVLVSLVPRLLRWNKDPYTIRNAEVNE